MSTTEPTAERKEGEDNAAARALFTRVLADIDGLRLIPRANYDLGRHIPYGYVFALREDGSNYVYISWSGTTRLADVHRQVQMMNPRPISVLAVVRRSNVHNARAIAECIIAGLNLSRIHGGWFEVDNIDKIARMFANIDNEAFMASLDAAAHDGNI